MHPHPRISVAAPPTSAHTPSRWPAAGPAHLVSPSPAAHMQAAGPRRRGGTVRSEMGERGGGAPPAPKPRPRSPDRRSGVSVQSRRADGAGRGVDRAIYPDAEVVKTSDADPPALPAPPQRVALPPAHARTRAHGAAGAGLGQPSFPCLAARRGKRSSAGNSGSRAAECGNESTRGGGRGGGPRRGAEAGGKVRRRGTKGTQRAGGAPAACVLRSPQRRQII